MNVFCFVGRKDGTQTLAQDPNNKHYRSVQLEEHYTVVGKPGTYNLSHFSSENGKGRIIAKKLFGLFNDTKLEHKLAIMETDGNASMTGKYNGCVSGWRNC